MKPKHMLVGSDDQFSGFWTLGPLSVLSSEWKESAESAQYFESCLLGTI